MMKRKRAARLSSHSPWPESLSPAARESPKSTIINKKKRNVGYSSASPFFDLKASSLTNNGGDDHRNPTSISDLKEFVTSRLDDIKRNLIERSHSEILKDFEASRSRLYKRFKIQSQASQQITDEAEGEYKKMSEWIAENHEAMKASYAELMEEAQVSASRVCKASIEELSKSFNKKVDDLRSHYGISST